MRPEYDFSKMKIVGRGIYAKRYRSGTNLVLLEPDVREAFPDDESVNEALRVIAKGCEKASLANSKEPNEGSASVITSPIRQSPSCMKKEGSIKWRIQKDQHQTKSSQR